MDFDKAAAAFDNPLRTERANALAKSIRENWGNNPNTLGDKPKAVLDFGCGTGLLSYALCPYADMIYGHDTSEGMRKVFEEKKDLSPKGNVRFLSEDDIKKQTYDVIFSSMVLHHIVDVQAQIIELKKLLSAGGTFIWIDLYREDGSFHKNDPDFNGHNGFSENEVKNTLQSCGFRDISIEPVFSGNKPIDGKSIPYSLFLAKAQ